MSLKIYTDTPESKSSREKHMSDIKQYMQDLHTYALELSGRYGRQHSIYIDEETFKEKKKDD